MTPAKGLPENSKLEASLCRQENLHSCRCCSAQAGWWRRRRRVEQDPHPVAGQRPEVPQPRAEHRRRHRQPAAREHLRPETPIPGRILPIRAPPVRPIRIIQIREQIPILQAQRRRDRLRTRTANRQLLVRQIPGQPTLAPRTPARIPKRRIQARRTRVEPIRPRNLRPPARAGKQFEG